MGTKAGHSTDRIDSGSVGMAAVLAELNEPFGNGLSRQGQVRKLEADRDDLERCLLELLLCLKSDECCAIEKRSGAIVGQVDIPLGKDVECVVSVDQHFIGSGHGFSIAAFAVDRKVPKLLHGPSRKLSAQENVVGGHEAGRDSKTSMELGDDLWVTVTGMIDDKKNPLTFGHAFARCLGFALDVKFLDEMIGTGNDKVLIHRSPQPNERLARLSFEKLIGCVGELEHGVRILPVSGLRQ